MAGEYAGAAWLDPVMGIGGAILVAHWSWGLLRVSAKVLLSWQAEDHVIDRLRGALLVDGSDRIEPPETWPQRACVGADLGDDVTLIEVVVTAVRPG